MASYDELYLLDDIDDIIDDVYDEGYADIRKATDELSGYDVYRQWIEPDMFEKALSPKQLQQRRDAAKSRARAAGSSGSMMDNMRARGGYNAARQMQMRSTFAPVMGQGRRGRKVAGMQRQGSYFRNPVRNKAFNNQLAAQGMQLRRRNRVLGQLAFNDSAARGVARRRALKRAGVGAAMGAALGAGVAAAGYRSGNK